MPLGGCRERLCEFLARCARGGCKGSETELARGCRERLCEFFVGSLFRGGRKGSETELALIDVRSLCRWAVAANACVSFLLARCARGGCRERV